MFVGLYNAMDWSYAVDSLESYIDFCNTMYEVGLEHMALYPICYGESKEKVVRMIDEMRIEQRESFREFEQHLKAVVEDMADCEMKINLAADDDMKDTFRSDQVTIFFEDSNTDLFPVIPMHAIYADFWKMASGYADYEEALGDFAEAVIALFSRLWDEKPDACPHCESSLLS